MNPVISQLLYITIFIHFCRFCNMSKLKCVEHKSLFQHSWTNNSAFIEQKGKQLCLECREAVALLKANNVKRQNESFHKVEYVAINGNMRAYLVQKLKNYLSAEQNLF